MDTVSIVSIAFGALGVLLGVVEFVRRERLLSRLRPWQRHARTLAAMGEEFLRTAEENPGRAAEAERTVADLVSGANALSEAMKRAGVEFRAEKVRDAE
jgi:hypothetical protein